MIAAFGERARQWAAGADVSMPTIAADESSFLEAIVEGLRRRLRGEHFAVAVFIDEEPIRFARKWAATALLTAKTLDERIRLCGAMALGQLRFDGRDQGQVSLPAAGVVELGRALWSLAEAGVVVSEGAYARLAFTFAHWHELRIDPRQGDPAVPAPRGSRAGEGHVVVWAAGRALDEIQIVLCGLEELRRNVVVVCDDPEAGANLEGRPFGVCAPSSAEPVLRGASAIVDTTFDHPGTASALAAYEIPLAVTRSSGALELFEGVAGYDPWLRDSILAAALEALGARPPRHRAGYAMPAPSPPIHVRERAPLVSVITPTHNRRESLPRALASVVRQTYPAIEMIVVNDDGVPVFDIAESFGARCVDRKVNGKHGAAVNTGLGEAHGEFVAFLDDDDLFFPDHISALVDAAEHSRATVAHSDTLMALFNEESEIVGFSPGALAPLDRDHSLIVCPFLGLLSMLTRRTAFDEVGLFDEPLAPNDDYEMIVRLAQRYDFVHVERISCVYWYGGATGGRTNLSVRSGTEYVGLYEEVYKRYAFPDRPVLAARRRAFLMGLRAAGGVKLHAVDARLETPMAVEDLLPGNASPSVEAQRDANRRR